MTDLKFMRVDIKGSAQTLLDRKPDERPTHKFINVKISGGAIIYTAGTEEQCESVIDFFESSQDYGKVIGVFDLNIENIEEVANSLDFRFASRFKNEIDYFRSLNCM